MAFITVTHFNKSQLHTLWIYISIALSSLTKLKCSTWRTSGIGEMSITHYYPLSSSSQSLICTVMRSNENLQALHLMNWNHCRRGTQREFNLIQVTLSDSRREDEKEKEDWRGTSCFSVFFLCLLWIVFEHIWAHLFSHRESPVQLTWTISRETKASVEGGGVQLYGQVETQQPHFLLISPSLYSLLVRTWFSVTLTSEFRLSHLDIRNHLHYSAPPPLLLALLSTPLPPPKHFSLQSQQLLRPRQTEAITAT